MFTRDGRLRTVDIGYVDERGYFRITDRKKDMIVVVKADPALTEQELLDHCRKHLTDYKLPRIVEFRSEPLPKTNLGKILRRQLRDAPAPKTNSAVTPAQPAVAQGS